MSSRRRATSLGAVLLALALAASACGGSKADATDEPSKTTSATAAATPSATPTPTPTPTAEPLSPFEDRAPVKAARAWADALARAVNANTFTPKTLGAVATPAGIAASKAATSFDTGHGYQWPGPQPFTPVNLQVKGATARIYTCLVSDGWAIDPATGKLAVANKIGSALLIFKRSGGRWLFDSLYDGTADCAGVKVKKVKW
jgi:hypothetical protein